MLYKVNSISNHCLFRELLLLLLEFDILELRPQLIHWSLKYQGVVRTNLLSFKRLLLIQSPHKWWSTLKSAVFGSSSSLPPLVSERSGRVCESVGKADLLSDHFDSNSPGRLLICRSLVIHLVVLPPLRSGRVR